MVYEIKSLEPEATTRVSSEVVVDAADRETPLTSIGPIAEIRGGSPSMRAFAASVCAAMMAATLLLCTTLRVINIDVPCGGVAPNVNVRCSYFWKPNLDAAEELGPSSLHSNQIQTSGIAHSNRYARSNFSSRGTGSCTKRDANDQSFALDNTTQRSVFEQC